MSNKQEYGHSVIATETLSQQATASLAMTIALLSIIQLQQAIKDQDKK